MEAYHYKKIFILLLCMLSLKFSVNADDFTPPTEVTFNNETLSLHSSYTYKRGFIFKVFEAALYTDSKLEKVYSLDSSQSIALRIQYYRDIKAEMLNEIGQEILQESFSPEINQSFSEKSNRMDKAITDVKKGDFYTLHYQEDNTLSLYKNDEFVHREEGEDFAKYYLSIWLGNHPTTQDLSRSIRGEK